MAGLDGKETRGIFSKSKGGTALKAKPAKAITKPTPKAKPAPTPKRVGNIDEDKLMKTTMSLNQSQMLWMDKIAMDVRIGTGAVVDRGMIVRAMLQSLMEAHPDLSQCENEESLKKALLNLVKISR